MSTQVTYKGSTIANFTNDTKTLKTAGKYMEDDVTITEVIAGQGNVWQDEDGYVHLDDESGLDFQAKSVNPTESSQTVRPDAGYTALSQVTVGPISSTYVGSGITRRNSEDSNFTIISKTYVNPGRINARLKAPEGYYASNALKTTQFDITSITDLPTQTSTTVTPTTSEQTVVSANTWVTGDVKVSAMTLGQAFTPAVTITTNPTFTFTSSTGKLTAAYTGSSNVTPTVTAGYITAGTSGEITTTGTNTYTLATQAAAIYNVSTADQTIASYRWLTGVQTIKSVITENIFASNIKSGVTVKVGDANNASRITQVTGTLVVSNKYTATIRSGSTGNVNNCYVRLNNSTKYYTAGDTFEFSAGDILYCYGYPAYSPSGNLDFFIHVNAVTVARYASSSAASYSYTMPAKDIEISMTYSAQGAISIFESVIPLNYMAGTTVTPSSTTKTLITSSKYLTSNITINGDANLVPSNIASGVSIFGVNGTHVGGITPTGTYSISSNGIYDITNYASVDVNTPVLYNFYESLIYRSAIRDTDSDFAAWANTLTKINKSQFMGQGFIGSFTFNNVSRIEAFGFCLSMSGYNDSVAGPDSYSFPECTFIGNQAFNYRTLLAQINLPKVTTIESNAFYHCNSLNTVNGSNFKSIYSSAFFFCKSLSYINLDNVTTIGNSAFAATGLISVNAPKVSSISPYAFANCSSLTTVSFSSCTSIGMFAFRSCYMLSSILFPECRYIDASAFANCSSLTTVSFSACTTLSAYAFQSCTSLTTVSFPACTSISNYAFQSCTSLTIVSFPACTSIGGYIFSGCYNLTTALLPACTSIGTYTFYSCYNLLSLYLLGSSVCSLASIAAFYSTPISTYTTSTGGVYGSIYVPSSLYDSYKTATNWKTYSSRFASLTDAQINNVINYGRHDP